MKLTENFWLRCHLVCGIVLFPSGFCTLNLLQKHWWLKLGYVLRDRRDVPEEEVVKLWMGFLSPLTRNSMQVAGDEDAPAYVFVDGDLIGFMPFADGLVAAAQEHFAFETGVETLDGPHAEPGSVPELGKRMADMEEKFGALDGKLESILQAIDGRSAKPPPEVRPGVLRTGTRYRGAAAVPKFPGLDQSLIEDSARKLVIVNLPTRKHMTMVHLLV